MSRMFFLFGRTHKPAGSDQVNLSSWPEERLNTEFPFLRQLDYYRQNPAKLTEAIERAHYAAEVYRLWQQSGALIRDIVLRLSDGNEIKIDKATPDNIKRFGFRFRSEFPRGSALNFYKQADKEFREVLLYSIDLDRIPVSGHSYAKTYENGQTLMLEIEPGLSGQFNISVDYTMPSDAADVMPSRRNRLFKQLPFHARRAALILLPLLMIVAFQKKDSIYGLIGEAASGAPQNVDMITGIPAVPPPPPVDDQASQSSQAGLNAEEKSGSPSPRSENQQPKLSALDTGSGYRLASASTLPAGRRRAVPDDAGETRDSAHKPNDVEQFPPESTRPPAPAPGDSKFSGAEGTEDSSVKRTSFTWELGRPKQEVSELKESFDCAVPPSAARGNVPSRTQARGKNKIPGKQ